MVCQAPVGHLVTCMVESYFDVLGKFEKEHTILRSDLSCSIT